MNRILVIAEHDGRSLNPATAKTVSCARRIGGEIDVALFIASGDEPAREAARLEGVRRVRLLRHADFAHPLAAVLAPHLARLAGEYSHLLAPSTTFGKDVLPRVAALLGAPQVSDIMAVEDARTFRRPIYAGNVIVTVRVPEGVPVVGTVRTASWPAAATNSEAPIETAVADLPVPSHTRFLRAEGGRGDRPDLQSAARVVSGGRGVGSRENFELIFRLADKLGAAVGASRAAVDAGFVPNELQVGQTGKIIAPDLYIAIGISGAIQHVTGIKDARTIVAINKDPDAPIFEVADIGLVGDLFKVLPELEKALDAAGKP
ncbi:MAG TPA: FAD-binding protein [Gammaproteobacteria bacterium]|nr:FAD-binding protein [Gammaproteobacteria bacterium]